jgi:hypothetical protein
VAVHEGSTLLVVINALRLLAYRDPAGRRHEGAPNMATLQLPRGGLR